MDTKHARFLKEKANHIRDEVIEVAVRNKAGHIAPSLSSVDILVALYYYGMTYKSENPLWEERDRLVFSKSHGCYSLYAILSDLGVIPKEEWQNFYSGKSHLSGCVERMPEYGLEAGCGSLGHGLPIATGIAFAGKVQKKSYFTFCIMGDGELQEGSIWEALQFAVKHELSHLIIIIDSNNLQAMDFITNILDREKGEATRRLTGFGLQPILYSGHNVVALASGIAEAKVSLSNKPKVIIAETIKGYGLKCMENMPSFHFRIPTKEELRLGRSYE
jgi:transketolase